jgi:sugar phosphate isomerase/epimerase
MKILFSTGTLYRLPLLETFRLVREAGFDGCDVVINRGLDDPRYKEILTEALSILPAYSLHVPFHRLKAWGTQVEALARCVEMAKELGIRVVNFHPPSWYHHEITFYRWFRQIEFGVKKNLYFTFDTTHVGTFEYDAVAAFLAFHKTERLRNVHLSDCAGADSHLFLGRGALPVARLLNTMRAVGYDEMVTLEVAPHELPVTKEWLVKMMRYTASFMKMHLGEERHG